MIVEEKLKENEIIEVNKKERKEEIELLRIISMFMVLLLHYCGKGGFLARGWSCRKFKY